jgi:hypothetical protein
MAHRILGRGRKSVGRLELDHRFMAVTYAPAQMSSRMARVILSVSASIHQRQAKGIECMGSSLLSPYSRRNSD